MARETKTCLFDFIEIGFRGNKWVTGCGKELLYVAPMGKGEAVPPLPTDNKAKFCTFCGKKIRLTSRKPKQQPVILKCPEPERPRSPFNSEENARPEKPVPVRPQKSFAVDANHNTYDGWKAKGYQVQAGQKSIGRNSENLAMFHINQTKPIDQKQRPQEFRDYEWDDYDIPL